MLNARLQRGSAGALAEYEDGLVVQLAGDVEGGGHLPAQRAEPGQDGGQQLPALHRRLPLRPPGRPGQLVLLAAVVGPHLLDPPGPGLLHRPGHAVQHLASNTTVIYWLGD